MPTKRSLQQYDYPHGEVEQIIELKKENTLLPTESLRKKYDHFKLNPETNQLEYRGRILVPDNKVRPLIDEEYKKSFAGMNRLFQQILRSYIGVSQDAVEEYVKNQEVQQIHDNTTTPSLQATKERPMPKEPMTFIQMDLSFFKFKVLFVAIDVLSKFLYVTVIKDKESKTVVRALRNYLDEFGKNIQTIALTTDRPNFKRDSMPY